MTLPRRKPHPASLRPAGKGAPVKALDLAAITEALGDMSRWAKQCHAASLHLVKSGVLPAGSRVARGFHLMIGGQHSWVTVGPCYQRGVTILDPTLWSYTEANPAVFVAAYDPGGEYLPHGAGDIIEYGRPVDRSGPAIKLRGHAKLSDWAKQFLADAGPKGLDFAGWHTLAKAPVGDNRWPGAEIIEAMSRDPKLSALVPIDIVGMATDRNPGGLYLAGPAR